MKRSVHIRTTVVAKLACALLATLAACTAREERLPDRPFVALDGQRRQLSELQGHVTLVHFWSTGCAPCLTEMPQLVALHQQFAAQGLETLAVAMPEDAPAAVIQYAQSRQLPFRVVLDMDGSLQAAWGPVVATPTTLVLDAQGRVVQRIVGPIQPLALAASLRKLMGVRQGALSEPHITRDNS
jgi:thiol-disulfide isomerase/thioredoxin